MTDIPDWQDMPESFKAAIMSWEDVYLSLYNTLGKEPTRNQVITVFDRISESVYDAVIADVSIVVSDVISVNHDYIPEADPVMEYCQDCNKDVDFFWELLSCDKNPQGLVQSPPHGNKQPDGSTLCEDDYCNPTESEIESEEITKEYVDTHNVHKKCRECNAYIYDKTSNN